MLPCAEHFWKLLSEADNIQVLVIRTMVVMVFTMTRAGTADAYGVISGHQALGLAIGSRRWTVQNGFPLISE